MRNRTRKSGKSIILSALTAASLVVFVSPNSTAALANEKLDISDDVLVEKFPNRTLYLDFVRPKTGDGPFPLVVCIHGGGWSTGNRKQMRDYMLYMASAGYASACIEYRSTAEAKFPAQINDAAQSINYLIDRASEFKINTNKIALYGVSSGGHIALMLSGVQNDIDKKSLPFTRLHAPTCATVSLAGPTDLSQKFPPYLQELVDDLFSEADRNNTQAIAQDYLLASPITFVDAQDPPMLLIHGTKDVIVPFEQSQELISHCREKSATADLIPIEGGGHGGGGDPKDMANSVVSIFKFLKQHFSA